MRLEKKESDPFDWANQPALDKPPIIAYVLIGRLPEAMWQVSRKQRGNSFDICQQNWFQFFQLLPAVGWPGFKSRFVCQMNSVAQHTIQV